MVFGQETPETAFTTIHWKAIEEHFLMIPSVFDFNHWGDAFSDFSLKKTQRLCC
jgi:hypothetical protein